MLKNKLQRIVTSYRRPKYLEPCLESMKAGGDVELYVVDGDQGGGGVIDAIKRYADDYRLIEGNPGADVLKNVGIRDFVTQPIFCITSDDFLYPAGWAELAVSNFMIANGATTTEAQVPALRRLRFAMLASPTEQVIARHTQPEGVGDGVGVHYQRINGIELMPTGISMVAGTIMHTEAVREVGGFPVYGKTGQGDIAISRAFRGRGFQVGYLRHPVIQHLGRFKGTDYPEYTADWNADDAVYQQLAREHNPRDQRNWLR